MSSPDPTANSETEYRISTIFLSIRSNQVNKMGDHFYLLTRKTIIYQLKKLYFKQKIRMQSIFKLGQVRYNYKKILDRKTRGHLLKMYI